MTEFPMCRLHEDDLPGQLLTKDGDYKLIRLLPTEFSCPVDYTHTLPASCWLDPRTLLGGPDTDQAATREELKQSAQRVGNDLDLVKTRDFISDKVESVARNLRDRDLDRARQGQTQGGGEAVKVHDIGSNLVVSDAFRESVRRSAGYFDADDREPIKKLNGCCSPQQRTIDDSNVAVGFYSGRSINLPPGAEVRALRRSAPPKPVIVWVVCDWEPSLARFSVGGVFTTELEAAFHCDGPFEGIGPLELGKRAPHANSPWPGFYYPNVSGSRQQAIENRERDEQRLAEVYAAESSRTKER